MTECQHDWAHQWTAPGVTSCLHCGAIQDEPAPAEVRARARECPECGYWADTVEHEEIHEWGRWWANLTPAEQAEERAAWDTYVAESEGGQ